MDLLEEEKKKLEEAIVENMITALEGEKITEDEMSTISGFVLDGVDAAKSKQDLEKFLEELAGKWELFKPLLILQKAELQEKVEDEVAQGVLLLLEHGKLDHAIKLAQSVTQNKTN
ncbi:MAG TPA: hypothetical protein VLF93_04055 [Candidatus Saccharimonadales bacterium]|nr:hypothetical protein [Candidatus Saccharimonadales bacterium]